MSFADFASNDPTPSSITSTTTTTTTTSTSNSNTTTSSFNALSFSSRQAIDSVTIKLEQFQRQVLAIKRASTATTSSTGTTSLSLGSIDEDLHDRIRFACLLQEEIASQLGKIPINSSNSLLKRKVCKDFQVISTQLETSVRRVAAREQEQQRTLIEQQQHQHQQQQEQAQNGHLIAEHQGQVFQFAELESEIAHNEALIEEREQDIHTIHQSVAQVNEIFRDLAAIVHDQQSAIDDIETHVHESMEQTKQGLNQVKKASEMQTSCMIQ